MVLYRRNALPGGTFFFTVTLRDRAARTLVEHVDLLRAVYADTARRRPFRTDALVVLPDHLHALWTLPEGDGDFSGRWRAIKSGFVRGLAQRSLALARNERGEALVWQRRFWEHTVRDERDFAAHCDYIHYNPVKHGHALRPADWPHSTFHRYWERGVYAQDWGAREPPSTPSQGFGEP
ncbi:MAG: transposase [Betaproteobacteria bacterium]|nr:transposase [Betaproteobacteria bacterium]